MSEIGIFVFCKVWTHQSVEQTTSGQVRGEVRKNWQNAMRLSQDFEGRTKRLDRRLALHNHLRSRFRIFLIQNLFLSRARSNYIRPEMPPTHSFSLPVRGLTELTREGEVPVWGVKWPIVSVLSCPVLSC